MLAPLIADGDPDLAGWQGGQQDTVLEMVCGEVRKYCGWHVAPSLPVTAQRCWFGGRGLITMPSAYVTEVDQVVVGGQVLVPDQDYFWDFPRSWLQHRQQFWPAQPFALIDFVHGYEEVPMDVKAVVFELLSTATELPASNANVVMTMEYRFNLNSAVGITLSENQKQRLGRYRITKFGSAAARAWAW